MFKQIKGLVNTKFKDLLDQLSDTTIETVYKGETYLCVCVIGIKGTQIVIEYHSSVSLLDQYNKLERFCSGDLQNAR